MNAALLTTIGITTGLVITMGAVDVVSTITDQALGQEATNNINNTTAIDGAGTALFNMTINDNAYPIDFNITGGILDTISIDGDQAILLVSISASTSGGRLTIELPRDLIDSKTGSDTDKPYLVYEDNKERSVSFIESNTTEQARTLEIKFNNEDDLLEIQGTEVLSKPGGEF